MTANLSFLRRRGSGIGGMMLTASWCHGCGDEIVNASTATEALCRECRKLDDQALVERMAGSVSKLGAALRDFVEREPLVQELVNAVLGDPQQLDADQTALAVSNFGLVCSSKMESQR